MDWRPAFFASCCPIFEVLLHPDAFSVHRRLGRRRTPLKWRMLREVVWMGDSKKKLQEFPKDGQRSIGSALMLAQFGGTAEHVKPFKGVTEKRRS